MGDNVYLRVIVWETIWYQRVESKTLMDAESRPKDDMKMTKETVAV